MGEEAFFYKVTCLGLDRVPNIVISFLLKRENRLLVRGLVWLNMVTYVGSINDGVLKEDGCHLPGD